MLPLRLLCSLSVLLLASCTGSVTPVGGAPDEPDPLPPIEVPDGFAPAPAAMQRLTIAQYQNSVRDILGDHIVVTDELEPDTSLNGFASIGASRTTISGNGVDQYEASAYEIAAQALAVANRATLVSCTPDSTFDQACAEQFVSEVGRRLFRRSLTETERDRYVMVAEEAAMTLNDFYEGLQFALAGLLQSPNFLFRVELGEGTGRVRVYSDLEMASRLSYVLWNTTPDEDLLAAAEAGELTDEESLRTHVMRMVGDERVREAVRNFFSELFLLEELEHADKDQMVYPGFSDATRHSAAEETLRVVEHRTVDLDADYRDLFTTYDTFIDGELGAIYGLGDEEAGFSSVSLDPEEGRRGLLGHASILAIHSHDVNTSAARRGVFVRQTLLCGTIPPPPPDVSTTFPPSDAATLRERVERHLMNEGCAACHSLMDPIGLGLENFDAIGQYRETENDAVIDPSGEVDGVSFTDAADLGRVIADHPDLGECFARSLYRYSVGNLETDGEQSGIEALSDQFSENEFRVLGLMVDVVMSPGFRLSTGGE